MRTKDYKLQNLRIRYTIWFIVGLLIQLIGVTAIIEGYIIGGILTGASTFFFILSGRTQRKIDTHKIYKTYEDVIEGINQELVNRTLLDEARVLRQFIFDINEK